MDIENIKLQIVDIIAKLFNNQCIDSDVLRFADLIDDLGMDSITFISIVIEVEACFDIVVPDDMLLLERFRCVDDIAVIVEKEMLQKEKYKEKINDET